MDVVNNLEMIIPKMREQLYLKKIYSLDLLYQAVEEKGKYLKIKELDQLLSKFGIFLKSQEITSADILGDNKTETKLSDELKKDNNEDKPPVKPENEDNKNDLIDDLILEDIDLNNNKASQEKKEGESQSFSTSNMNSLGADSSVGPKNNNNFDYVEEADKKV